MAAKKTRHCTTAGPASNSGERLSQGNHAKHFALRSPVCPRTSVGIADRCSHSLNILRPSGDIHTMSCTTQASTSAHTHAQRTAGWVMLPPNASPVRINDRAACCTPPNAALLMPGRAACACRSMCWPRICCSLPTTEAPQSPHAVGAANRRLPPQADRPNACPMRVVKPGMQLANIPANCHQQCRSSCCTQLWWALLHTTEPSY